MGELASDLARVWARNTVLVGLALLVVGVLLGFTGPRWTLALLVAGWLELWTTWACLRSWWARAEYRWFWWTR